MSDSKPDSVTALPTARAATASRPSPAVLGQAGIANADLPPGCSLRNGSAECGAQPCDRPFCEAVSLRWKESDLPISDAILDQVAFAIERARCPGREGPYGGYDYGHNTDFYGPEPAGGRYVVRDFRDFRSPDWGKWVHQTACEEEHEQALLRLTGRHIAEAAITAYAKAMSARQGQDRNGLGATPASAVGAADLPETLSDGISNIKDKTDD